MHKGLVVTENVQQLVCLIGDQASSPHELKYSIVVMEIISGRKNLDTSGSEMSIHLITLFGRKGEE